MLMLYIYFFYLASQAQTLIMGRLLMLWAYSVDTKSVVRNFYKIEEKYDYLKIMPGGGFRIKRVKRTAEGSVYQLCT